MRSRAAVRSAIALGALAACFGCVGYPSIALGPRQDMALRPAPPPAQPLVATPATGGDDASFTGPAGSNWLLPPSLQTSLAAIALYLMTGATPFITVFGLFDENRLLGGH